MKKRRSSKPDSVPVEAPIVKTVSTTRTFRCACGFEVTCCGTAASDKTITTCSKCRKR